MRTLIAIGGAMDLEDPVIFKEFIRRAGGEKARIVILPQASGLKDAGDEYVRKFRELGVKRKSVSLEFRSRVDADLPRHLQAVRNASGIFIAGGTQMRLSFILGGTKLESELRLAYQRGTIIAGTSAGAAILSRVMLAYGRGGPTPRERIAQFSQGFGFTDQIIFDQHFRQRDRFGRLAYAVTTHPGLLGVGVDENTAAIVENDAKLSVIGRGAVTIVDGRRITASDVAEITASRPIAISGLQVHVLTQGCSFDIRKRTAHIPPLALE
ncbi:MAG: cyanophycinase [Anaerolineales bacterium]|nr:cyanophycinase [Anaerolineae bacterium]PWB69216.1 MAG: cyanophycinase [Anaerolineales bacterium]